ncbi:Uncharacterized protein BM_BM17640 [Brugia malayi]|uniref:HEPN domain-containing protein n=1 Tax=Brugia malayi TaxID=6279 RepID=A0A4E9FI24_BRUMA|nr:Uncharacterized protein BM_BM17640 [Brugia malayi]VIO96034.1 Uncharacterized protein BM_BM17640 [Brugia malayi]
MGHINETLKGAFLRCNYAIHWFSSYVKVSEKAKEVAFVSFQHKKNAA